MIRRIPKNAAAGVFLIAVAALALWQTADLVGGSLRQMGPGMLPRVLASLLGVSGIALIISAYWQERVPLDRWSLRGLIFILGAVTAFGVTVRPLGLAVAGPLALIISVGASSESRILEIAIFGLVMTGFCILLFKVLLGLPIPVAPWLLGY